MASGATLAIFTALSNNPPASNPATLNLRNGTPVLEFDPTTQEIAIFLGVLPRHYAGGGITVYVHFAAKVDVTNTIGWDVAFERIGAGVQDLDADGFASAKTITAVTVPGIAGFVDIQNVAFTNGAEMDSLAVGEAYRLRVRRDVANDTAAGDAQLLAVELKET